MRSTGEVLTQQNPITIKYVHKQLLSNIISIINKVVDTFLNKIIWKILIN